MIDRLVGAVRGQHVQARCPSYSRRTRRFYVNDRENPYCTPRGKPFVWIRGRQLGGRLRTWARVAIRMSQDELRPPGEAYPERRWPFGYDELARHYDEVERTLGVRGQADGIPNLPDGRFVPAVAWSPMEWEFVRRLAARKPGIRIVPARTVCHDPDRLPRPLAIGLATGRLHVRTDAVVGAVTTDPGSGRATGVSYVDRVSRLPGRAFGRIVVLCASAFESVRILLNSTSRAHPTGIGNSSGLLGRYVSDHVLYGLDGPVSSALRRLPLLPYPHEDARDLASATLYVPWSRADRLAPGFAGGYGILGAVGRETPWWWLLCFGEMMPRRECRITLQRGKTDAWGIPALRIDCDHSVNEVAMARHMRDTLREIAEIGGLDLGGRGRRWGALSRLLRSTAPGRDGAFHPGLAIHEIGGARMGDAAEESVLNRFCQCWDADNVFVTDGACFPGAGYQNHTLTIMANTVRVCEFILRDYLGARP